LKVVLRAAAEADVRAAYGYYGEAGAELAEVFVNELDGVLRRLLAFPRSAQPVEGFDGVRRAVLRRFPFAVFYVIGDEKVIVLRVLHTARSAEVWPDQ
jgi:toxin ParE1/3/4